MNNVQIAALFTKMNGGDYKSTQIASQFNKINHPAGYSSGVRGKVEKAAILVAKIRGGMYPDHRKRWDDRISDITGIKYSYASTDEKSQEKLQEEEPIMQTPQPEPAPVEDLVADEGKGETPKKTAPLFQLTIDADAVVAVINAWKGR